MLQFNKIVLFLALIFSPHCYSSEGVSIIRDDEIEASIAALIKPVLIAGEVNPREVSIIIVADKSINAFVNSTHNVFINSGLLMQFYDDPDLVLGVVAHELAHIKAGHLAKADTDYKNVKRLNIISTIILGAAAIANHSPILIPTIGALSHISERTLLSYSRQNEQSADRIATSLLEKSKNSAIGLKNILEYFRNNDSSLNSKNPYALTHPMPSDRLLFINNFLSTSKYPQSTIAPKIRADYVRAMLKLRCFIEPKKQNLSSLKITRQSDMMYAKVVLLYLSHQLSSALELLDALLVLEPKNAYFYELKAQMLYENGRILEALTYYKKAYALRASKLISYEYAYVLIEGVDLGLTQDINHAIDLLKKIDHDDDIAIIEQLARAYGKKNQPGISNYYIAKAAALKGDTAKAQRFGKIALKQIPITDAYYLKVQDILKQEDRGG
jgi:predicted Zn-dependent protease